MMMYTLRTIGKPGHNAKFGMKRYNKYNFYSVWTSNKRMYPLLGKRQRITKKEGPFPGGFCHKLCMWYISGEHISFHIQIKLGTESNWS